MLNPLPPFLNSLLRVGIHAQVEVAAGQVDPHRLGRAGGVRQRLKLQHGALVVAQVEGAVAQPQVHLLAALAALPVELQERHRPRVVPPLQELLQAGHFFALAAAAAIGRCGGAGVAAAGIGLVERYDRRFGSGENHGGDLMRRGHFWENTDRCGLDLSICR